MTKSTFINLVFWGIVTSSCYAQSDIVIDLTISPADGQPFASKQELQINLGSVNVLLIFYVDDYDLTVTECAPGYICPFNSTKNTPCPKGTYSNLSKAYDISQCLECPHQMACPEASFEPINCSIANLFTMSLYNKRQCNFTNETMTTASTTTTEASIIAITSSTTAMIHSTSPIDTTTLANVQTTDNIISTTTATACAIGYYYNITLSKCMICPVGFFCPMGSMWPIPCPQGTYIDMGEGATSRDNCNQCVLGTYSAYEAQVVPCSPCPIDNVCVNPSMMVQCPQYTTSPQGSTSMLKCVCLAGYECSYKKQLVIRISVNTTQTSIAELQNNTALIEALRSSVAKASNVDLSSVIFKGFRLVPKLTTSNTGRRLLASTVDNGQSNYDQQQQENVAASLIIDNS